MKLFAILLTSTMAHAVPWMPAPETDITGYLVSYGTTSGVYPTTVDVGLGNKADLPELVAGNTYYVVLSSYNEAGMHSEPSAEITYVPTESSIVKSLEYVVVFETSDDLGQWTPLVEIPVNPLDSPKQFFRSRIYSKPSP